MRLADGQAEQSKYLPFLQASSHAGCGSYIPAEGHLASIYNPLTDWERYFSTWHRQDTFNFLQEGPADTGLSSLFAFAL